MNRVIRPERIPIRESGGGADELAGDLQPYVSLPVRIELAHETSVLTSRQVARTSASRECRARFDVRDRRRRHDRRVADLLSDGRRSSFLDVDLYERAGIEVEPQRRSSRTV